MVPAHKQTDPNKAPGQIVPDKSAPVKTIGDYVISVQQEEMMAELAATNQRLYPDMFSPKPKKLSFEEWLHHRFPAGVEGYANMLNMGDLEQCWKAAQENK